MHHHQLKYAYLTIQWIVYIGLRSHIHMHTKKTPSFKSESLWLHGLCARRSLRSTSVLAARTSGKKKSRSKALEDMQVMEVACPVWSLKPARARAPWLCC